MGWGGIFDPSGTPFCIVVGELVGAGCEWTASERPSGHRDVLDRDGYVVGCYWTLSLNHIRGCEVPLINLLQLHANAMPF